MPYKTKAERERENWMTLPDAVAHIQSSDQCDDEGVVHRQLHAALADGALRPLRWEQEPDDRPPPFGYTPIMSPTDTPPIGRDWLSAKICWNTGKVRDDWSEHKNGKWRVLLVHRLNIERHWPLTLPSDVSTKPKPAKSAASYRKRPKREAAETAIREEYPGGVPPTEPDPILLDKVGKRLKEKFGKKYAVSNDTILRAADRRPD
jgi:hypothetical protein